MGKKVNKFIEDDLLKEITSIDIDSFSLHLNQKIFNTLIKKGQLEWFDSVLYLVDRIYKKKHFSFP